MGFKNRGKFRDFITLQLTQKYIFKLFKTNKNKRIRSLKERGGLMFFFKKHLCGQLLVFLVVPLPS